MKQKRWERHIRDAKDINKIKQCRLLNSAIRKYGSSQFEVEFITYCDIKDNNSTEEFYIKKFNTLAPDGYNLTSGRRQNIKVAKSVRKRLSFSGKKYFSDDDNKIKQSKITQNASINSIIKRF